MLCYNKYFHYIVGLFSTGDDHQLIESYKLNNLNDTFFYDKSRIGLLTDWSIGDDYHTSSKLIETLILNNVFTVCSLLLY